jgi:hypothetical protein
MMRWPQTGHKLDHSRAQLRILPIPLCWQEASCREFYSGLRRAHLSRGFQPLKAGLRPLLRERGMFGRAPHCRRTHGRRMNSPSMGRTPTPHLEALQNESRRARHRSRPWRICRDTYTNDRHKTMKADYILANPPSISRAGRRLDGGRCGWKYGQRPPHANLPGCST